MKKVKVGFFKKVQGVFSEKVIKEIKTRLTQDDQIELLDELDYKKFYLKNNEVFFGSECCLNDLEVYFWHDSVCPMEWGGDNYYLNVLEILGKKCNVINSAASTMIVNDKFLAHSSLAEKGLPVVDFALVNINDRDALSDIFDTFEQEVLIKPRFGGWGIGVLRVNSKDQLFSLLELIKSFLNNSLNQQILIEKYYPNDIEKWCSVSVFGEKVILGYRKKIERVGDWKIYDPLKKGGRGDDAVYIKPTKELTEVALKASRVIGKDIIGFDFIFTEAGYKIVDENGRPGLYEHCLESAKINIAEETVALILSKLDKNKKNID